MSSSLAPTPSRASASPRPRWLADRVFSTDARQRVRIQRWAISLSVYVAIGVITGFAAVEGLVPVAPLLKLQAAITLWMGLVYAALRSGWNLRLADPSMSRAQILGAEAWIMVSYALCPPFRGVLLTLLALVLVFGIFNLETSGRRTIGLGALVLMGATMAGMAVLRPQDYPPRIELIHFLVMATILPAISTLGAQLSEMRNKLKQQKNDLSGALVRIQELATRDELTGLFNRRHMAELITQAVHHMQRSGQPFSLCLIDLDHFKRINDLHGHRAGDEVLRRFARHVRDTLRATDHAARWGGEEFLLLMPETNAEAALVSLQRLRTSLQQGGETGPGGLRITFSAGLTEFAGGETVDDAVERADQALYQAKASGRNRIVVAEASAAQRDEPMV